MLTEKTSLKTEQLIKGIKEGRTASLARSISLVENGRPGFEELLSEIHSLIGRAHRIGLTGPPGAGKSALAQLVTKEYREQGRKVAIVAVDPTSPFSGGALLGDRIRMESVALDPGVFIRSMASRGAPGGLATTTLEVCDVLDAFGFERIIIETVGVGQSELAIAATADTAVLIVVPESGDGIQVLKAGVMEIADLYVVNKADRPGADKMAKELQMMLGMRCGNVLQHVAPHHGPQPWTDQDAEHPPPVGWNEPVLTTSALKGQGITKFVKAIESHRDHLVDSGQLAERRDARLERHVREVVERSLHSAIWQDGRGTSILGKGLEKVLSGAASPYQLAQEIVDVFGIGAGDEGK